MTVNYKDWQEMLPFALLAYRTSIRSSTGATPYSLVYGMEAVLPIEVEIPSMRVLTESKLKEAEWTKQRYKQLNLIDERRLTTLCHGQCYQQRMTRTFNKKVRPHEFSPSDLVLRKVLHIAPDSRGKFAYKYDGPFIVKEGSVPFGYVLTTFLLRGHPLRVRPDYFSAQGSVPFGYVPTTFLLGGPSPSGVISFGYVPTTFMLRGHPLRVRPDYSSVQGSVPFGSVLTLNFCLGVRPFRSFSAFRVKNRHSRVNSARRVPAAHKPERPRPPCACLHARACPRARAPPMHSSCTPRAPSSPNVHALATEHSSKRSTESPDSRTLSRLFPRIPRLDHPDPKMPSKLSAKALNGMAET
ncbi:hypothetical protein CRG98_031373 [Punica granatum]|uniref:Uncharacterized protein n=1 Tax=Punica granatum TaxID=22663 RepID=A0A2I0IW45_PUNGR|nr:hypothetical protein CRG98_031373 [Punica granatum]